jgi:hypothetical protein
MSGTSKESHSWSRRREAGRRITLTSAPISASRRHHPRKVHPAVVPGDRPGLHLCGLWAQQFRTSRDPQVAVAETLADLVEIQEIGELPSPSATRYVVPGVDGKGRSPDASDSAARARGQRRETYSRSSFSRYRGIVKGRIENAQDAVAIRRTRRIAFPPRWRGFRAADARWWHGRCGSAL